MCIKPSKKKSHLRSYKQLFFLAKEDGRRLFFCFFSSLTLHCNTFSLI